MTEITRVCTRCKKSFPENQDFFYIRNPSGNHKTGGYQPACKTCWITINAENKAKRKLNLLSLVQ